MVSLGVVQDSACYDTKIHMYRAHLHTYSSSSSTISRTSSHGPGSHDMSAVLGRQPSLVEELAASGPALAPKTCSAYVHKYVSIEPVY